jgi:hypothetical protein
MSDVPVWNCEFAPVARQGATALDSLTVGSRFLLKCHGDIPVTWEGKTPPTLVFAKEEQDFTLAILNVFQQTPNAVEYEVTAYKPGQHKPEYVRVMQGLGTATEKGFEFDKPTWTVQSVLPPKQQAQPYGPFGQWNLALPLWFWLTILLVLAAIIYAIVRQVRRYTQRRRMLEELARHKTAVLPLHQFYKDARNLRRRLIDAKAQPDFAAIASDLNREFRLFVLRKFQIPTLNWSNPQILRELRRKHRANYNYAGDALKQTLRELSKLGSRGNLTVHDLEQVQRMSLDTAERLESTGPEFGGRA